MIFKSPLLMIGGAAVLLAAFLGVFILVKKKTPPADFRLVSYIAINSGIFDMIGLITGLMRIHNWKILQFYNLIDFGLIVSMVVYWLPPSKRKPVLIASLLALFIMLGVIVYTQFNMKVVIYLWTVKSLGLIYILITVLVWYIRNGPTEEIYHPRMILIIIILLDSSFTGLNSVLYGFYNFLLPFDLMGFSGMLVSLAFAYTCFWIIRKDKLLKGL